MPLFTCCGPLEMFACLAHTIGGFLIAAHVSWRCPALGLGLDLESAPEMSFVLQQVFLPMRSPSKIIE